MEAADNRDSGISKGSGHIVCFEYDISGAFDRTEETKQIPVQNTSISNRPKVWIAFLNAHFLKGTGAFGTIRFNFFNGVHHGFEVYPEISDNLAFRNLLAILLEIIANRQLIDWPLSRNLYYPENYPEFPDRITDRVLYARSIKDVFAPATFPFFL
ncbi:MAG: hypothetical protein JRE14_15155 [Deltaproteobacteria bacterium]|nr:hypothetical protein [Deltaproteobacteria bacterium]